MDIYSDKRDNKAAKVLSRYSPDIVQDIIRLCSRKSGSILQDIYSNDSSSGAANGANLRPYAILSKDYVDDDSFDSILLALDMIVIAEIRKPNFSNDRYQAILQNAFSLPREIAEPIAKKIETYDVLGGLNPEGRSLMTKVADRLKETARRVANYAAGLLQLDWEIDQSQKYDIDFLYELKLLGDAAREFNTRARLMTAQAAINTNLGLLQSGDINDPDTEDELAGQIGDVLGRAGLRMVPASMFGTMLPSIKFGTAATQSQASQVLDAAGITTQGGKVEQTTPSHPLAAKIIAGVQNASPSKALLAGLLGGAGGALLSEAIKAIANKARHEKGDLYGEIGDLMGDDAASAWVHGDIDGMMSAIGDIAANDESTGDIDLDRQIEQVVRHQYGDIDEASYGPQLGGLFTRARINIAKRTAARHKRHSVKKGGRQYRRNRDAATLAYYQKQRNADLDTPFDQGFNDTPDGGGDQGYPDNSAMPTMDPSYMPGDYSQSDQGVLPEFFGN